MELIYTPHQVAEQLHEYNLWRKGEGSYEWNEDPSKNKDCPLGAHELSVVIAHALHYLETMK